MKKILACLPFLARFCFWVKGWSTIQTIDIFLSNVTSPCYLVVCLGKTDFLLLLYCCWPLCVKQKTENCSKLYRYITRKIRTVRWFYSSSLIFLFWSFGEQCKYRFGFLYRLEEGQGKDFTFYSFAQWIVFTVLISVICTYNHYKIYQYLHIAQKLITFYSSVFFSLVHTSLSCYAYTFNTLRPLSISLGLIIAFPQKMCVTFVMLIHCFDNVFLRVRHLGVWFLLCVFSWLLVVSVWNSCSMRSGLQKTAEWYVLGQRVAFNISKYSPTIVCLSDFHLRFDV